MEILTRGTCRFPFFSVFFLMFYFLFYTKLTNSVKCFCIPIFPFIALQKVVLHLLASLPFSSAIKLRTCIGILLSFNIIKSSKVVFVAMSSQSRSTFSSESSPTCFLQYIVHLLHIILKFAFLSWQVPRSSVGGALYRESGPSQDGDPVPGNLPFFLKFFYFFFSIICYFSYFIPSLQIGWSVFVLSQITFSSGCFHI